MNRIQNVLFACLLPAAGCASQPPQPAASAPDLIPKKLKFEVVGIVGPTYHVELSEGFLAYSVKEPGQKPKPPLHLSPTSEQWKEFRHQLDRLKVWQWKSNYGDKSYIDGTQWSLDIEYSDRSIHSEGHRDFPGSYEGYLKAVGNLLGSWEVK